MSHPNDPSPDDPYGQQGQGDSGGQRPPQDDQSSGGYPPPPGQHGA
ncbi:DUF4870 domain-containing protein, partial [Nocardiopsis sp. MG754419]|nr:DUF4870 domain-containing protein [Nocardiopsis sp. MG754419]